MKTLHILILALALLLSAASAQTIKINSVDSVVIGDSDEPLADALLNASLRGVTAKQIQDAFRDWVKALVDAKAAAETDATKKLEAAEELKTVLEKPTATDAEKAAAKAKLADSKTPEVERERKRLRDEKAAIQAKLDALPAEKAGGGGGK